MKSKKRHLYGLGLVLYHLSQAEGMLDKIARRVGNGKDANLWDWRYYISKRVQLTDLIKELQE